MKIKKLAQLGSALVVSLSSILTLAMPLAHAAGPFTCTWTGGGADNNFSTDANWSGCNGAAPVAGDADDLAFPVIEQSGDALTNDLTDATFGSITSSIASGYFYIAGNAFTLNGDLVSSEYLDIRANVTLSLGSHNFDVADEAYAGVGGLLGGAGSITKIGLGVFYFNTGSTISYSGATTVNEGGLYVQGTQIGDATGATTVNTGASLFFDVCTPNVDAVIAEDITFNGAAASNWPKLGFQYGGGSNYYGSASLPTCTYTLSGDIVLGSNAVFGSSVKSVTIAGALSGAYQFTLVDGTVGNLIVDSSSNTSSMANNTYSPAALAVTLSDNQAVSIFLGGVTVLTLDGTRNGVTVGTGGTLKGTGTTGWLYVGEGGILAPGHSPGCLTTGDLTLRGTYQAEIGGTTACTGYDQLKVTGAVDVTGATLSAPLYGGFVPAVGQSYTIIDNDGADAVVGTFTGLAEGATFTVTGVTYSITYVGGDGNDVALTVTNIDTSLLPGAPDTGLRLIMSNPLVSLMVTVVAAGILVYTSRRLKTAIKH